VRERYTVLIYSRKIADSRSSCGVQNQRRGTAGSSVLRFCIVKDKASPRRDHEGSEEE